MPTARNLVSIWATRQKNSFRSLSSCTMPSCNQQPNICRVAGKKNKQRIPSSSVHLRRSVHRQKHGAAGRVCHAASCEFVAKGLRGRQLPQVYSRTRGDARALHDDTTTVATCVCLSVFKQKSTRRYRGVTNERASSVVAVGGTTNTSLSHACAACGHTWRSLHACLRVWAMCLHN